jgi:hypothetical protein
MISQKGKTTGSADKDERLRHVSEFLSKSRNCHKRKKSGNPQEKTSPRKARKRSVIRYVFFALPV